MAGKQGTGNLAVSAIRNLPYIRSPGSQGHSQITSSQITRFRSAIAKGCYRKSPWDTCRTVKLKLTLTLVLTLTATGGTVLTLMLGYRSLYITWQ